VSGSQISGAERGSGAFFQQFVTVRTFLGLIGIVYLIAFTSFGVQAMGLVGSHGILPFGEYLPAVRQQLGGSAYWNAPTLLWLSMTDSALRLVWIAGAALALAAATGFWQRTALAGCLVLWLSVCTAGQDFFSFQWDILLSEAGFLALFLDQSAVRILLFRWLIFRLMFFSGAIKLLSGDPAWRNLTAMTYHYETQPLPTPLAWHMHQAPAGFQKASTAFTFVVELIVPLLFFAPKRIRHGAAWLTIGLQVLILTTGNYTFFNLLTIILAMALFIEWDVSRDESRAHRGVSVVLAAFIGSMSLLLFLELFSINLPPGGSAFMRAVSPLRIVNSYGLFAVMTTKRQEIVVEGSNDGNSWLAYEFPYKPGDVMRAPPVVAPHQPRLDWQMWFAALGTYQENRWFVNFMLRVLQGEPAVLRLLRYNPFPNAPPKYVRARLYLYHFTRWGEKAWWTREERGLYFPAVSLK
jgi:Lipase maturation factor